MRHVSCVEAAPLSSRGTGPRAATPGKQTATAKPAPFLPAPHASLRLRRRLRGAFAVGTYLHIRIRETKPRVSPWRHPYRSSSPERWASKAVAAPRNATPWRKHRASTHHYRRPRAAGGLTRRNGDRANHRPRFPDRSPHCRSYPALGPSVIVLNTTNTKVERTATPSENMSRARRKRG